VQELHYGEEIEEDYVRKEIIDLATTKRMADDLSEDEEEEGEKEGDYDEDDHSESEEFSDDEGQGTQDAQQAGT
jgi:hypothetical protein